MDTAADRSSGAPIRGLDWSVLAGAHRASYLAARPWPHVVLDNVLDPRSVHAAEVEELQPALQIRPHRSHREVKAETSKVAGSAARQKSDRARRVASPAATPARR